MSRPLLKLLLTVLVVGASAALAAAATAYPLAKPSGATPARRSVELSAPRATAALYRIRNARPGEGAQSCIRIAYRAPAPIDLRLYMGSPVGPLGRYVELTVEAGAAREAAFPRCAGFRAVGRRLYEGTLADFAAHRRSFAKGLLARPERLGQPANVGTLVYRISVRLRENAPANAARLSTGQHGFRWEARARGS